MSIDLRVYLTVGQSNANARARRRPVQYAWGIMSEPFDVYSDGFSLGTNGHQVHLSFALSMPADRENQDPSTSRPVGTVRMDMRQLRAITFLSWRLIRQMEQEGRTERLADPPNMPDVSEEEWQSFWSQPSER